MMKRGTVLGWVLITLSIMLGVWVVSSQKSHADKTTTDGFVLSDDEKRLISYTGDGGNITVPSTVTTVDSGVFANNSTITGVKLPSSVTTIGSNLFSGCSNLQTVDLGNVTSIPQNTFQNCYSLSSVSIPSTVTSIDNYVFYGCAGLGSISLPSSVTSISSTAFNDCANLNSISIGTNGFYSSSDGCLYNSSGTRLIMVPPSKSSISFPSSVNTIGSNAFSGCYDIHSITVPDSVTTIESGAFNDSGISSITIPDGVTSIGSQGGWKPSQIYGYGGSEAEKYANTNNIPFIDLHNGSDPSSGEQEGDNDPDDPDDDGDGEEEDIDDEDDGDDDGRDDSGNDNKKDKKDKDDKDNGNKKKDDSNTGGGNSGKSGGGNNGGSSTKGGSSGKGGHTKDSTPKTADGDIDPRFALCFALLLGGAGIMVLSRKRQMEIVRQKKTR